jgi:nucleotide-binding universal stress UspA family protein
VIGTIVVGTDGSDTAETAVRRAGELAKATGAALHIVSAHGGAVPPDVTSALLEKSAGALHVRGIECECHARQGDPAEALLAVAGEEQADVIVVGNKGMHSSRRFLLGSVPDKISHHAGCSVLIVRTT